MNDNREFKYVYSAPTNKEVQKIRSKYLPKEESKMDELRRLDRAVQSAGRTESLIVGVLGALIFGVGMCMGLEVLVGGMVFAVILGIIGAAVMISAYPIFHLMSEKAKSIHTPRILQLANELEKINNI